MSGVSYAQSVRVQKLSTTVFGQKHRLATMAAIAQSDGLVNPTDLAIELGFHAQSAVPPIRDLTEAGLITRQDGPGRVYYRRNPAPNLGCSACPPPRSSPRLGSSGRLQTIGRDGVGPSCLPTTMV